MLARCGVSFIPRPTLRMAGPATGAAGHRRARAARESAGSGPGLPTVPGREWWPVSALGRAVHLLPAGEVFRQGYGSTSVALCGELVTSGPDGQKELANDLPQDVCGAPGMAVNVCPYFIYAAHLEFRDQVTG